MKRNKLLILGLAILPLLTGCGKMKEVGYTKYLEVASVDYGVDPSTQISVKGHIGPNVYDGSWVTIGQLPSNYASYNTILTLTNRELASSLNSNTISTVNYTFYAKGKDFGFKLLVNGYSYHFNKYHKLTHYDTNNGKEGTDGAYLDIKYKE